METENDTSKRKPYLSESEELFEEITTLLYQASQEGMREGEEDLFIPLTAILNTAVGIRKLLWRDTHTENESFMLMRALLERLVNFHYLRLADPIEREKYEKYPFYKVYHNTIRQFRTDNTEVSIKVITAERERLKTIPEISQALDLFSAKDRTLSWTDKTFKQKVALITKKGSIDDGILELASLLNYSDSSEVLHGSMYGLMILTGMWDTGSYKSGKITEEEISMRISKKLTLQLCLLAGLMLDTVPTLNIENKKDEFNIVSKKHKIIRLLELVQQD